MGFRRVHPGAQLALFAVVLGIAMFSFHPVISIAALVGGLLTSCSLRGGAATLRQAGYALGLGVLTAVLNPLFVHRGNSVFLYVAGRPLTVEALLYGACMGLLLAGVFLWFGVFSYLMDSARLHLLLSRAAPGVALLFSMTLRFFPLFLQRLQEIRAARAPLSNGQSRLRESLRVFSGLTFWALEHAAGTTFSMAARGYGTGKRTCAVQHRMTLGDVVLLVASLGVLCLYGAMALGGQFTMEFYPVAVWRFSAWPAAGCYFALCCVPALWTWGEELLWKYSLSTM